jgi:hypothetical protein
MVKVMGVVVSYDVEGGTRSWLRDAKFKWDIVSQALSSATL